MKDFRTTDMTLGSVSGQLVRYALPMIITSLLQAVYSIVDIVIAGHFIGGNGISAINNSSLVIDLITKIAIGFTVGGNVLMSQYFGSRDQENCKRASGTLLIFSLLTGVICLFLLVLSGMRLMRFLGAPALSDAVVYLQICAFGMPFVFGYNAISATLRALGDSRNPLYFILLSTSVNIVLDILFVAILHMGVAGAAFGTLTAQCISFLAALFYSLRHRKHLGMQWKYMRILPDKLRLIVRFGFPLALQMTVASISWLGVMVLINRYGVVVSAGNGISNKIKDFCQLFISAATSAAATMVAQNLGAGKYERAKNVMKTCMRITLAIAFISIAVTEIFAPQLAAAFTSDPGVAVHAIRNLRIEIVAQVFYAMFLTYNVLATGSGHTMFVMGNSFLNCIVVRLILAVILQQLLGVTGIYLACMIAPSSSVPVGWWFYRSGKWKCRLSKEKT